MGGYSWGGLKARHGYLGCRGGTCIPGVGQGVRLNSMDWIRGAKFAFLGSPGRVKLWGGSMVVESHTAGLRQGGRDHR